MWQFGKFPEGATKGTVGFARKQDWQGVGCRHREKASIMVAQTHLHQFGALLAIGAIALLVIAGGQGRGMRVVLGEVPVMMAEEHDVPAWEWNDENVGHFLKACEDGNDGACDTLVRSREALERLNRNARSSKGFWDRYTEAPNTEAEQRDVRMEEREGRRPIFYDWDDTVPLAKPIEQREFQGADAGNVLVPVEQVPRGQGLAIFPWVGAYFSPFRAAPSIWSHKII